MSDVYWDGLDKLTVMYVTGFCRRPDETLQMFCTRNAPLEVMNSVYGYMTNGKLIKSLEDLPQETKEKLWAQVKGFCPGATKQKAIKLCRCVWLINSILEK